MATRPDGAEPAHELGRRGEEQAALELIRRGFEILDRNVRLRSAEVDLIARDAAGLIFVEVKSRTTARYGYPYEAVSESKRERLSQAALEYISSQKLERTDFRIGVVSVIFAPDGRLASLEWIDEA
jgi:putative endonuclease